MTKLFTPSSPICALFRPACRIFTLALSLSSASAFLPLFAEENKNLNPVLRFFKLGQSQYTTLNPATELGQQVLNLYDLITWVGIGVFAIVALVFVVVVYRFREKKHPVPKDTHGNFLLEMLWTSIPLLILIIIAVPTVRLIFKLAESPTTTNRGVVMPSLPSKVYPEFLEANVVGHQWWWEFEFVAWEKWNTQTGKVERIPIHRTTANEPFLPVNIPIKLNIVSEDVIHSFWLPRMIGKIDVMPGQINHSTLIFEQTGFYKGECALYCGASHAKMRFNVRVVDRQTFQDWLGWGQGTMLLKTEAAKRGAFYAQSCMACHTMNGMRPFQSRDDAFADAAKSYEQDSQIYEIAKKDYTAKVAQSGKKLWARQEEEDPNAPAVPKRPVLFQGNLVTIAPDLTDIRFRDFIASGILTNNSTNLTTWISDPPSIKPEISGTPTIRMPIFKHIYSAQEIADVVEFLNTVEFSQSPAPDKINAEKSTGVAQNP